MAKVSRSLKNIVRKRASNSCEKCGAKIVRNKAGFHNGAMHHRKPRRLGGPDTVCNLVWVCLDCHREIHRDESTAARQGWIAWSDPDVTPALLACGGWALLVPDGSFEYLSHQEGERLVDYVNSAYAIFLAEGLARTA